jgi:quinol monooxygenase YgiN
MGQMVVVVYRPKAGRADDLLDLIREHVPILRAEGLATERAPLVMRAADGVLVEIFEWESPEAIERAHTNPTVLALWGRFGECCEYGTLASLPESQRPFSPFQPVTL